MAYNHNLFSSYEETVELVESIAESLKGTPVDIIVPVVRGGLIPGVILSHLLKIPVVPLMWSTRDFKTSDPINADFNQCIDDNKSIIIIDDINDSGATFSDIKKLVNGRASSIQYVSVYERHNTTTPSDYYGKKIYSDAWVSFEWENAYGRDQD